MTDETAPSPEAVARARVDLINEAETEAWNHLARAVDKTNDFATRRREGEHAAALFTCIAAVMGQPTLEQVIGEPEAAHPDLFENPTTENDSGHTEAD